MRGTRNPPSLRWEWAPPPNENPYPVLEEFGHLYIERETFQRPRSVAVESDQQKYVRRQERKAKKVQRNDKVNQRLRKVPGAYPD